MNKVVLSIKVAAATPGRARLDSLASAAFTSPRMEWRLRLPVCLFPALVINASKRLRTFGQVVSLSGTSPHEA